MKINSPSLLFAIGYKFIYLFYYPHYNIIKSRNVSVPQELSVLYFRKTNEIIIVGFPMLQSSLQWPRRRCRLIYSIHSIVDFLFYVLKNPRSIADGGNKKKEKKLVVVRLHIKNIIYNLSTNVCAAVYTKTRGF